MPVPLACAQVEAPYTRLLQATDAAEAAVQWESVCIGLKALNAYMLECASTEGPFFLGGEPSLAEASTAPALYRMVATLPVVRDLELVRACEELKLGRLVQWLTVVLERPADCCDVVTLPPHVYVALARKLHVRYEGPPSPCYLRSRAPSSEIGGVSTSSLRGGMFPGQSQRGQPPRIDVVA